MCAGNELFFVALYFIHFSYGPTGRLICINAIIWYGIGHSVVWNVNLKLLILLSVFEVGNNSVGLWTLLAYVSFPIFFLKQLISMLHLVTASQDVVSYDMAERRKTSS